MPHPQPRPHQREAVDAIVRDLEPPAGSTVPERGLRTQVVMATGSGKTLAAVRSAEELRAGRVLVLVPSLGLLAQTETAWREGGRTGPMIGVSSLRAGEAGFANTTDVDELVAWVRPFDKVTVFVTYASLGLGTLERAHTAGLPGWDLIVVDEAHRTSGRIGKPWAAVHDNTRIPALRRLYMTATPRLWQLDEDSEGTPGVPGELVALWTTIPRGRSGHAATPSPCPKPSTGESARPTGSCAWTSPTPTSRLRSYWAWKAARTRCGGRGSPLCRRRW
ncbi:DEAD/DEAH box helicase family protein [Streptomyces murinus]|uniref:DEAD/DEAH box helicase family protein n=1 Tax=Streptomyces murinus TaxID=33900 RepID=UPI0039906EB9